MSISVDRQRETMKAFLDKEQYNGKWMTLHNSDNGNVNAIKIDGYPTYFIPDSNRKIITIAFFDDVIPAREAILKKMPAPAK